MHLPMERHELLCLSLHCCELGGGGCLQGGLASWADAPYTHPPHAHICRETETSCNGKCLAKSLCVPQLVSPQLRGWVGGIFHWSKMFPTHPCHCWETSWDMMQDVFHYKVPPNDNEHGRAGWGVGGWGLDRPS